MSKDHTDRYVLHKMTAAQFAALLDAGWDHEDPGVALVCITQALAKQLLDRMQRNRPPKEHSKQKVAAALRGGYWSTNGEPIILNKQMQPLDGQNRLLACIETGIEMLVVVSWGWPDDCFDTIDTGVKRSGGDMFSADGEDNANLLAAAVRYDWRIMRQDMLSGRQIPEPLMRPYLDEHAGLRQACTWGALVDHLVPRGLAVALFYRFSTEDPQRAKQFFTEIGKGENINSREHTTWHLRSLFLTRKRGSLHLDNPLQAQIAANLIKGWQGSAHGKVLTRTQLLWYGTDPKRQEPFPRLAS